MDEAIINARREYRQKRWAAMTEEQRALERAKARDRARIWRANNPERAKAIQMRFYEKRAAAARSGTDGARDSGNVNQ